MFHVTSFLLAAAAAMPGGSEMFPGLENRSCPSPRWHSGGAIIDRTGRIFPTPHHLGQYVQIVELRKDDQVVLSLGSDQGIREGQVGWLIADTKNSMRGRETIEILEVGDDYAVGRFLTKTLLGQMLSNEENPVRNETFLWFPFSRSANDLRREKR